MEIKIIISCIVKGETKAVGEVGDFGESINRTLMGMGRAIEYTEKVKAEEVKAKETAKTAKGKKD